MAGRVVALYGLDEARRGELSAPDEAFWRYCGRNSGNLLYRFAIHRAACPDAAALTFGFDLLSSKAAAAALLAADLVVMPMANLLRDAAEGPLAPELLEETRFAHDLARSLRAAGKGLLLVSLGYEGLADASEAQLHPEQLAMVAAACASAGAVVLRGPRTAALLERHGLCPAVLRPLGCPSALLLAEPRCRQPKPLPWGLCLPVDLEDRAPAVRAFVERAAASPGTLLLLQDEEDEATARALGCAGRIWQDPELWLQQLPEFCEAVLSFRIHGALAALAAGVPTAIVPLGHRVAELAQLHRLPTLDPASLAALDPADVAGAVREACAAGLPAALAELPSLRSGFRAVLDEALSSVAARRGQGSFERFDAAAYRAAHPHDAFLHGLSDFGAWHHAVTTGAALMDEEDARLAQLFPAQRYAAAHADLAFLSTPQQSYLHFRDHGLREDRASPGLSSELREAVKRRAAQAAADRHDLDLVR